MIYIAVIEWVFRVILLFVNSWLIISIYRSKEVNTIYIFLLLYFIVANDCLQFLVYTVHDIPSYFRTESIFADMPFLYNLSTAVLSVQWFFQLFFLPVFSLLHFCAIFFPFAFRHLQKQQLLIIVLILYLITAAVTVPLFTSCCGFIYHVDFHYWFFDYTKPYTSLYQTANNVLQFFCIGVMVLANICIIVRLFRIRKKNSVSKITSIIAVSSSVDPSRKQSTPRRKISISLSLEVRLGISFVLLSCCFFVSTISFNLLTGNQSPPLMLLNLICGYLNYSKWIVYCLGNKNIRRAFLPWR